MTHDALKLTIYFGESDRIGHHLLSDVLLDEFAASEVRAAALLRAVEGFGLEQHLHTQRLLTLSEDLPLVAIAVDRRAAIEPLVARAQQLVTGGLLTLERARLVEDDTGELQDETKLTVYLGRQARYVAVVDLLRERGLDGATVLLGVDGVVEGRRERARFVSRNARVPLVVIATGSGERVARAIPPLRQIAPRAAMTVERIRLCKRGGVRLAVPHDLPERDDAGLGVWQKLTVHAPESARHGGHALHLQLIRRLREEGAAGATALRGIWGYSGNEAPHGDGLLGLRRRVPVLTVLVDSPEAIQRWWRVVDEVTDEAGLVTSEMVPAFHAVHPELRRGGLHLARLRF
jgi:PII-like signaling protein